MKSLRFNGIKKQWLYLQRGRRKTPFASINRGMVKVPGKDGAVLTTTELDPVVIYQPVGFRVDNDEEALLLKDELASWLYTQQPVPLQFDDEPSRTYYAVVQNTLEDFEKMATVLRRGTIQFLCCDPLAYGTEQTYDLSSLTTIANEGTADTYPVFDLEVLEDSTLVEIANLTNQTPTGTPRSIVLGNMQDINDDLVDPKQLVLHDTMQSTSGWQGASDVDSGFVSGMFGTDGNGFYVEDWGEDGDSPTHTTWIGPSLQKAFADPLDGSFYADIHIENRNEIDLEGSDVGPTAVGIIEVYMRDANDQIVCKMQFGDTFHNAYENFGTFVTTGARVQAYPANRGGWNNFNGVIRIMRDSNLYLPYIAMIDDQGNHTRVKTINQIRPGSVGRNPVTNIQVAIRKPFGGKRMYQRIKEIKVYKTIGIYEQPDNSVPIAFKAGDRLHIDVAKGLLLLNGEVRTDLFSLETDFFSLVEGLNRISKSDNVQGTVTFRNRYK